MACSFQELVQSELSHVPSAWMQGRALFGGAPFAVAARAAAALVPVDRPLRSFQGAFVGPVTGPAAPQAEVIREGRSYTSVRSSIVQDGTARCELLLTYGADRPGTIELPVPTRVLASPDGLGSMPFIEGVMPNFVRFFDLRWVTGHPPFSGASAAGFEGWCAHRTDPGDPVSAILGLIDAWPSPALALMTAPAPASSVTWGLNLVCVPDRVAAGEFFYFEAAVSAVTGGHAHCTGRLWSPEGKLVAESMQLVAVYGGV